MMRKLFRGLSQIGYFLVEVGEGGFEGLLVVGMSGRGEVVDDADTRELKILDLFFAHKLFRCFGA